MGDIAKDLTAGTVGGVAQLVVGHPFDTIKVKLQSQPTPLPGQLPKYSGAIDAVRQTLAAEGAGGGCSKAWEPHLPLLQPLMLCSSP